MEQSCDAVGLQMHPVKDVAPELGHSWREEKDFSTLQFHNT